MPQAEHFLYFVTRGRKSGQPRAIEIWYVDLDERFYIVAEKREATHWVKNVQQHGEVLFSVGTRTDREARVRKTPARARVLDESSEPDRVHRVRALMNQKYGWSDGLVTEIAPVP